MQYQVGVTLEEGVINQINLNSNISTRNIGLLMQSERGAVNSPTMFTNPREYTERFGGKNPSMMGPYFVENLFLNAGLTGATVYGIRLVGEGTTVAQIPVYNADLTSTDYIYHTKISDLEEGVSPDKYMVAVGGTLVAGHIFELTFYDVGTSGTPVTVSYTVGGSDTIKSVVDALIADITDSATWTSGVVPTVTRLTDDSFAVYRGTDLGTGVLAIESSDVTAGGSSVNPEVIFTAKAGYQGTEDMGDWGNNLRVNLFPKGSPNGDPDNYVLEVRYKNKLVEPAYVFPTLEEILNDVNYRSGYIMLEPNPSIDYTDTSYFNAPAATDAIVTLTGGFYVAPSQTDYEPGINTVTSEPKGLAMFGTVDAQIIACTEIFDKAYASKGQAYADEVGKYFVFNTEQNLIESTIKEYYDVLATTSRTNVSGYFQWQEVSDGEGSTIWIPVLSMVLGAGYVRKAAANNMYAWNVPGGTEAAGKGIIRLSHEKLDDSTLARYVKKHLMNVVKHIPNYGFVPWSSRTYSTNPLYHSAHISLETNWLVKTLLDRNQAFAQRLISPDYQREVKTNNQKFLESIYDKGGIEQSVSKGQAIIVEVIQDKFDRKRVDLKISWIPPECSEHVHITLSRNDGILQLQ